MKALVTSVSGRKLEVGVEVDKICEIPDSVKSKSGHGTMWYIRQGSYGIKDFSNLKELVEYVRKHKTSPSYQVGFGMIISLEGSSTEGFEEPEKSFFEAEKPDFILTIYDSWIE